MFLVEIVTDDGDRRFTESKQKRYESIGVNVCVRLAQISLSEFKNVTNRPRKLFLRIFVHNILYSYLTSAVV